ncbi:hypothetical protein SCLCIDRAFT_242909 [Scleroderma citrinum Foug A]|uniref:Uncharacterized protein n=1 Tax=Scleroderma citrinum Foug A TaxID=1036808 RepID=A0A0C2ZV00_9AGAM|nr:hypothetical protein SCLCIDRAFT_242909 [Scleroderma citrinum Foug A]
MISSSDGVPHLIMNLSDNKSRRWPWARCSQDTTTRIGSCATKSDHSIIGLVWTVDLIASNGKFKKPATTRTPTMATHHRFRYTSKHLRY